jgi:hypothetical protein
MVPNATPAGGATQVVNVTSVKEVGGPCRGVAGAAAAGGAAAGAGAGAGSGISAATAIIAGIAIGAGAGVGIAAAATDGFSSNSSVTTGVNSAGRLGAFN